MNNMKTVREIYGATQEQVASAIGVNRVTVANWENGTSKASDGNQEKLSLYFGIGPEFFYQRELDAKAKDIIKNAGDRARAIAKNSEGRRNKEEDFRKAFEAMSFSEALGRYTFWMKMLLATADTGKLETLKTALVVNKKMGARLEAIIALREEEDIGDEPSLYELISQIDSEE